MEIQEHSIDGTSLANLIQEALGHGASLPVQAKGSSMAPFIKDGDILTLSPLSLRKPGIGDVVACRLPNGDKLIIHRLVKTSNNYCLIRGDYRPEPDAWISPKNILACVSRIDRDGKQITFSIGPIKALIAFLSTNNILYPFLCYLYRRFSGKHQEGPEYLLYEAQL